MGLFRSVPWSTTCEGGRASELTRERLNWCTWAETSIDLYWECCSGDDLSKQGSRLLYCSLPRDWMKAAFRKGWGSSICQKSNPREDSSADHLQPTFVAAKGVNVSVLRGIWAADNSIHYSPPVVLLGSICFIFTTSGGSSSRILVGLFFQGKLQREVSWANCSPGPLRPNQDLIISHFYYPFMFILYPFYVHFILC